MDVTALLLEQEPMTDVEESLPRCAPSSKDSVDSVASSSRLAASCLYSHHGGVSKHVRTSVAGGGFLLRR